MGRQAPSLTYLSDLHSAHVHTRTFANVDVLLGHHPGIDPKRVQQQLLDDDRGGYCYEHAQLFAGVLEQLGFKVRRRLSRVHTDFNIRAHLCLTVSIEGSEYLCDPGFGFSIDRPIELKDGATRSTVGQVFTLGKKEQEGQTFWYLTRNGKTEHIIDTLPVMPNDARTGHLILTADPLSIFQNHLVVAGYVGQAHYTVTERSVTIRRAGQETEHREIGLDEAVELSRRVGLRISDADLSSLKQKFGEE
ncbi:arylamine N-acetyltransferase family protein [Rothia aerolata]|uniref:Arylamine N-acetyltransferase n=1 Tax=Rothia aerolata TaxID=1812262 RepID=A0A917IW19_9MICC|nr:arylamine N-acetyltransferase [Rothia aerolata]GGH65421.1 arylamine N-acetyltransferase [Rothia aerolata]